MEASRMRERPIIFSAAMVRAILDGRKTQTRRVVKFNVAGHVGRLGRQWHVEDPGVLAACPYGLIGDRLWVKETHGLCARSVCYRADQTHPDDYPGAHFQPWRSSIHMPRWASRITLEIAGVRVERLQAISEDDAIAEGIQPLPMQENEPGAWWCADPLGNTSLHCRTPRAAFCRLWESINGAGSWAANPWVWVIEFKRVQP